MCLISVNSVCVNLKVTYSPVVCVKCVLIWSLQQLTFIWSADPHFDLLFFCLFVFSIRHEKTFNLKKAKPLNSSTSSTISVFEHRRAWLRHRFIVLITLFEILYSLPCCQSVCFVPPSTCDTHPVCLQTHTYTQHCAAHTRFDLKTKWLVNRCSWYELLLQGRSS